MKTLPWLLEYFLQDCLDWQTAFSVKKMFWWYGIYKNGIIFAIYAFDQIFFKTSSENLQDFLERDAKIFSYSRQGKIQTIRYYSLPEEIMENHDELKKWVEKSLKA